MQQSNAPAKLVLPFANSGAKNTIPVASQIGIVPGAASFTDGFPPLTRTPLVAGGVPPSGLDMNGIMYALAAIDRWSNAGARYYYDSTFATDSDVSGYPKGAVVLRTDGSGGWLNLVDDNETDPEAGGAGWVPDYQYGITPVTMTSSNVTLTSLEAGKPIIIISGLLTTNLNLIFPLYLKKWTVVNNTTGSFTITAKTAAGTGVVVQQGQSNDIYGDGTDIKSGANVVDATTTVKGIVELATDAETQTGTDTVRAITPSNLSARTATETRTGIAEIATDAETLAFTDDARFVTPLKLKNLPIYKEFVSTDQTITNNGLLTIAHGLGEVPTSIECFLRCTTISQGWAVNDLQTWSSHYDSSNQGLGIYLDATNVYVRFADQQSGVVKNTGAGSAFTNANFRLIVKARI
jgi:hypothetical protein